MSQPTGGPGTDVAAVLEVVEAFDAALGAGDLATVQLLCLDDLLFYGSGEGEECVGPQNLADMLARVRAAAGEGPLGWSLELQPYDVVVRGDTARVTASGRFELVQGERSRSGRYLLTGVLVRTEEGWRWWSFHGSEPQGW